jgi:archaellin
MLPDATILTNCILKSGSLAKIVVNLGAQNSVLSNQTFALQVTPPTGGILLIQRTAPAQITQMTDLH